MSRSALLDPPGRLLCLIAGVLCLATILEVAPARATTAPRPLAVQHRVNDRLDPRAACRAWLNEWQPPPTIGVYRTRGPAAGTVQTVNFRRYVAVVMAGEWPASMPRQTLRAGAVAVKQYAWYYSLYYRGWLAPDGSCFHVLDNSMDQVYSPENRVPDARHLAAIEGTWRVSLRRPRPRTGSRLFLTSYRRGGALACGIDSDGLKLFQRSARACGAAGLTYERILRTYYGGGIEVVDVGRHDILADRGWRGDAAVLAGKPGSGRAEWRVYPVTARGLAAPVTGAFRLETGAVLDMASADVTGDGLADLVLLIGEGRRGRRLLVLPTTGAGYRRPQLWARWREAAAGNGRRLLLADFTGDGLADAGLLRADDDGRAPFPRAVLRVMAAQQRGGFGPARDWWSGGFDPTINVALAGDVNGDGRADLIVRQDRGASGLRYWVMPSLPTGGRLGSPRLWLEQRVWRAATTREVVIDENRDGRDDLFAIRPAGRQAIVVFALRATAGNRFTVSLRWRTSAGSSMPFVDVRPVALHVDTDGRGDLALFERRDRRTGIAWLRTTDDGMLAGRIHTDTSLPWRQARPF